VFYPPAVGMNMTLGNGVNVEHLKITDQIVKAFTVSDFSELLSKKNMLALIIFSILIGLATSSSGERGKPFAGFLSSGSEVMMKLISYIMYYAPIGLCA
jgi:Na+/H+-dicarboxylate symporter